MEIPSEQKIVALIGDPVAHSVSPDMHNAAFKKLGLAYRYALMRVKKQEIEKALNELRSNNYAGANITVPHKEAVIPLIDEIRSPVELIGAVNTIKNQGGKLIGYNTDGAGFLGSLTEDGNASPREKKVVLIGAGGGARAIAVTLAQAGVKSLAISDIDRKRSSGLASHISSFSKTKVSSVDPRDKALKTLISDCDILINATPVGMHPNEDDSPLGEEIDIPKGILVHDIIYNPAETKLLKIAGMSGARTLNGLGMLVRQGALSFEIFTGQKPPVEVMKTAALKALNLSR